MGMFVSEIVVTSEKVAGRWGIDIGEAYDVSDCLEGDVGDLWMLMD